MNDAILLVDYINGILVPTPDQFWAADFNDDGVLDVLDVVLFVNAILG